MKRIIVLALLCAVCWAAWTPGAAAQSAGVHATVDGGDADRVHLRASPSAQADSKGLYFTDTQVFCPQGVSQGWTRVVAGAEEGYMMTSYLRTDGASVQPRDGASSDAEATLCVPRGAYEQVTLDVKNGAGGLQCPAAVYGANARLSLTLASDAVHGYALHLIDSVCVFGIGETAQHYGILVENISGSTLTLTGDLPACQPGAASYAFTSGAGTAQIHVTGLLNSELEFIFVRA